MPKLVHIKVTEKVYWVSHEEFQVLDENRTSGAPYASSFYVMLLHIVRKKGSDIEVEYYGGVQFVENPAFKSILRDKAESEMKENLEKNIAMYNERVETFKRSGGNEQEKTQAVEPTSTTSIAAPEEKKAFTNEDLANELNSVKRQNKILLISIAVLLLSILIKMM